MEAIYVIKKYHWDKKLCRARFLGLGNTITGMTGLDWPDYNPHLSVGDNIQGIFSRMPEIVFAFKPLEHIGLRGLKTVTAVQYNEVHANHFRKEVSEIDLKLAIFHHYNDYLNYKDVAPHEAVHAPHVADPRIFYDQKLVRTWDFTLVGATAAKVYPLRSKLVEAVAMLNSWKFRCRVYEHPGYLVSKAYENEHLKQFAFVLNTTRIAGFCSSIYKYRLGKYVEAPACGAVVAADKPESEDEMDFILECSHKENVKVIAKRIANVLEKNLDEEYRRKGYEYAKRHTPATYCERLAKYLS